LDMAKVEATLSRRLSPNNYSKTRIAETCINFIMHDN
jgi:hypothetical protein